MIELVAISRRLSKAAGALSFAPPVTHVYDPTDYARQPYETYLRRYGQECFAAGSREAVLVGMNPGPFGMAQTGVPFGEVAAVRDWMGIEGRVGKPKVEHPKRPIAGFACPRSEVSGARLWGWAQERFGTPEAFFSRFFVINYCPLCFLEDSGRNRTPDKLAREERDALYQLCDRALLDTVAALQPMRVIGVGAFAARRAAIALDGAGAPVDSVVVGSVLHPSPASPKANRGWSTYAEADLADLGIELSASSRNA